ncbi:MAG: M18 family aminopeptidase [Acidimicrobiales bacterium]|nr:M18 family aminopeptidase [Acidimicrobiales bacterium]MCB9371430.1 M18 family aminopeptidase [Microthrixaceae bacterium]
MTPTAPPTEGLLTFIDASPSPFHAVEETARLLGAAGFTRVDGADGPQPGDSRGFLTRGGALVAWAGGHGRPDSPLRVMGAHTDSPNLRIKPRPDTGRVGYRQLGVEIYGGALLNSWLDRDLGLSGRVAVRGGDGAELRLVRVDRPLLRVPQLAIHLDREIDQRGLQLNKQTHLSPVWGLGTPTDGEFRSFLADELGVAPDEVLAWDVMTHDLAPSAVVGVDRDLISAPRLDNLCSCWAGAQALLAAASAETATTAVLVLFDHEEVGSTSERGAGGPLLRSTLERLVSSRGGTPADLHRALAGSLCASADMAHAVHPNYVERYEPDHHVALNGGPVIKHNANQRYATDAEGAAAFRLACERARVPVQEYVNRTDLACGSTIGPLTAASLGMPTVDVGVAQLAMHSARELAGADDPPRLAAALGAFATGG